MIPSSDVNGALNSYTFTIGTKVAIVEGDVFKFTFPDEIILPNEVEALNVTPIVRVVNDVQVSDELKAEMAGNTVFVTFIKVAESTGTYKLILENIKNPPSTKPSGSFDVIISEDS